MISCWESGWIVPSSGDGWILPSLVDGMDNTFVGRWMDTAFVGGRDESELWMAARVRALEEDGMDDAFVWGQHE